MATSSIGSKMNWAATSVRPYVATTLPITLASHPKSSCTQIVRTDRNALMPSEQRAEAHTYQGRRRSFMTSLPNDFKVVQNCMPGSRRRRDSGRYSGIQKTAHIRLQAVIAPATTKGASQCWAVSSPPSAGAATKANPSAMKRLPNASKRAGPLGMASVMQLPSMALWLASTPPTTCATLRPTTERAVASSANSTQYAAQHSRRTRLLPTRSDHLASTGVAASSTRLRSAVRPPTAAAMPAMSMPMPSASSWNRRQKAGVCATMCADVFRQAITSSGWSVGALRGVPAGRSNGSESLSLLAMGAGTTGGGVRPKGRCQKPHG
mmetsp:Transcript_705/g.1880  ORF Transcript_705/g.1880 Transcript_705/m.1880 type:complete len:322 (+) Transcript_705:626-1591(+)